MAHLFGRGYNLLLDVLMDRAVDGGHQPQAIDYWRCICAHLSTVHIKRVPERGRGMGLNHASLACIWLTHPCLHPGDHRRRVSC